MPIHYLLVVVTSAERLVILQMKCTIVVFQLLGSDVVELLKVIDAMNKDSGIRVNTLKVDGGMTSNNLLMQLQADLVGIDVGMSVLCTCLCLRVNSLSCGQTLYQECVAAVWFSHLIHFDPCSLELVGVCIEKGTKADKKQWVHSKVN